MTNSDQMSKEDKKGPKPLAFVLEIIFGIFGIYGIGHFLARKWTSGLLLFFFSFIWLVIEGIAKDVIFRGNYPPGLCALAFHAPVVFFSITILTKSQLKQ